MAIEDEISPFIRKIEPVFFNDFTVFSRNVSDFLSNGLVAEARACLGAWKTGQIDTLEALSNAIDLRCRDWLSSAATQAEIRLIASKWVASVLLTTRIDSENVKIILAESLRSPIASTDILSSYLSVEGLGAASIASDAPSILGTLLASLVGGVTASLLPILAGIGFPLGLILGAAAFTVGSGAFREKIKSMTIPVELRRVVLSDKRADKLMSDLEARVKSDTYEALMQRAEPIVDSLTNSIENDLLERSRKKTRSVE